MREDSLAEQHIIQMTKEDYIEYTRNKMQHALGDNFLDKYRHLFGKDLLSKNIEATNISIIFTDEVKEFNKEHPRYDHVLEYWVKINVTFSYRYFVADTELFGEQFFVFWGIGYIYGQPFHSCNYELLDSTKFVLKELQELKIETRRKFGYQRLFDISTDYLNPNIQSKFTEVCRRKVEGQDFDDFDCLDDLCFTQHQMVYGLAELQLYKPYVQDFLGDPIEFNGEIVFRYNHSFYDEQYFYISSQIIQLIGTFWDKIGNLLFRFFPYPLREREHVYFYSVVQKFPERYRENEDYLWLKEFKENKYKDLRDVRNKVTHVKSLSTEIFKRMMRDHANRQAIQQLQNEKMTLIDDLVDQYEQVMIGIERVVRLIDASESNVD